MALPRKGLELDVACGPGRGALWAARRGFEVLAVDLSPVALARLERDARRRGLSIRTLALDLESAPPPSGPFVLITCLAYLQRDLFGPLAERLALGGWLAVEIATRRNLERHPRPGSRFLLEEGELPGLLEPLELAWSREGWIGEGAGARHLARALARRGPAPDSRPVAG